MSGSSTILIVDDTESARETLAALLHPEGFHLLFAADGPTALTISKETELDLILLDVMMPGMNGHEVCRRLRASADTAEIPIIMITALDDADSRIQGIESGADNFITKPFNRGELRAQVRTLLRLNRYRRLLYERNRFAWVVEQADDGYLALGPDHQVLYANPQARKFLELPPIPDPETEAPGGVFPDIATPLFQCRPDSLWSIWPEPVEIPRFLVRPDTPAANALWLQVDLMPTSGRADEPFLVRLRDVTCDVVGRKLTWSLHRQISHKLKTPLNGLTGPLRLLVDEGDEMDPQERQEFLRMASDSAHRLQNEILDIFRYIQSTSAGYGGGGTCPVGELAAIAREVAETLGMDAPDTVVADGSAAETLPLSRAVLYDLMYELLENALKFHPRNQPASQLEIDADPAGVRICLSDDGLRLSPVQLARIWDPYYQADKDATGEVPGMGLGLSMVAVLVWEAGGHCNAYNRTDREGLVVELVIPPVSARTRSTDPMETG